MGTRVWKFVALAAVLGLLPTVGGCFYAAVGAAAVGTYAYVKGDLEQTVQAKPEQVVAATQKAFTSLKYVLVSKEADATGGKVSGKSVDNTDVTVKATSVGADATKISVRFGTFGDEAKSRILMDEIIKKL
jgi:hypothetical protein